MGLSIIDVFITSFFFFSWSPVLKPGFFVYLKNMVKDGRSRNGARKGENRGQGRKRKDVENKAQILSIKAMTKVFGSPEECFAHTAKLSKTSFPHLQLLFAYAYGKPPQELTGDIDHTLEIIRKTIK